jgi:hypothetical protein
MLLRTLYSTVVLIILFSFGSANAQYTMQKDYLGASIGLSFLGSAPQIGINYEHSMELQNFGRVGIGGIFRYWSYSESYYSYGNWKYTDVLIGAQGNYHFQLENESFDPWVGLVLAYDAGSVSWDGPDYNYSSPTYGGFFLGAQAGIRYWIQPNLALIARMGFGTLSYGALELGVDFKL